MKMTYLFSFILLMVLTFSTLVFRGVKSEIGAQIILSFLDSMESHVFLIQECGLPCLKDELWPHVSIWSGSSQSGDDDVAISIEGLHVLVRGSTVVRDGRALLAHLSLEGQDFNFLGIYGFNGKG